MERPRFKPRAVMEMAIKAMQHSIAESRNDDKSSPKVGAVLVKPDASPPDTAYRGEIRDGDHAEFTLLERKNRDKKLDGSVLFTTLEPCAPGARSERKLSCAERIVLARIKEVWVGIEDPDPKVDRKGIKYLQEQGVTVQMLNDDQRAGWRFLATQPAISKADYVNAMGYDDRKAQRHLKQFVELGLLRRVGGGKATTYEVVR